MSTNSSEAIHPMEREGCWLCDGCGEVETHKASDDQQVTVGCPVCIQNDLSWKLQAAETERDELAAWRDDAMRELTALQQVTHQLAHNGAMCWDYSRDARAVMDREPQVSLTRRDAHVKAEALDFLAGIFGEAGFIPSSAAKRTALRYAENYRKQVEDNDQ